MQSMYNFALAYACLCCMYVLRSRLLDRDSACGSRRARLWHEHACLSDCGKHWTLGASVACQPGSERRKTPSQGSRISYTVNSLTVWTVLRHMSPRPR